MRASAPPVEEPAARAPAASARRDAGQDRRDSREDRSRGGNERGGGTNNDQRGGSRGNFSSQQQQQQQSQQQSQQQRRDRSPPARAPVKKAGSVPLEYTKPSWANVGDDTSDASTLKKAKAVLNKLTVEKFARLSDDFVALPFDSVELVTGAIDMIVNKAQTESHFVDIYAELCVKLAATPLAGLGEVEKGKKFRRLLLERCQAEFERDHGAMLSELDSLDARERERAIAALRKVYIGHMFFIGALFKAEMLKESIMHYCIQELFGDPDAPDEEKIECLTRLLTSIGLQLDRIALEKKESQKLLKAYFKQLKRLSTTKKLSSRIRFLTRDLCELRDSDWKARRAVEKAKSIAEIHDDIQRESDIKNGIKPKKKFQAAALNAAPGAEPAPVDDGWESVPTKGGNQQRNMPSKPAAAPAPAKPQGFGAFGALTSSKEKKKKKKTKEEPAAAEKKEKVKKSSSSSSLKKSSSKPALEGGEAAVSSDAPAVSSSDAAAPALDEKAYKAKARAAFMEYMSIESLDEVLACVGELDALGGAAARFLLVADALDLATSCKDKDRQRVAPLLLAMHAKGALGDAAQVAKGCLEVLEFLHDIAIDTPKASEWLGDILKALASVQALDLALLDAPPASVAEDPDASKTWATFKTYVLKP